MKEILKYLRQTNSYTQAEIASKLEISRQSYIKYENGDVEPSDKIIRLLSIIYGVNEDFIRKNEIPKYGQNKKEVSYEIKPEKDLHVASTSAVYGSSVVTKEKIPDERRVFEGFFDGSVVRILDSIESLKLKKGQKIKLYVEDEDEEADMKRRKAALERFLSFKGTVPEDFDEKEEKLRYLEEKYGPF